MQSVYATQPYDIQYTLPPQHIIVNSPQAKPFPRGRFGSQHDYRQYVDEYQPVGGFNVDHQLNSAGGSQLPADFVDHHYEHQPQQDHLPPHLFTDEQSHQGLNLNPDSMGSNEDLYRNNQYGNSANFQMTDGQPGSIPYDYHSSANASSQSPAPNLAGGIDFNSAPSRTVYLGNVPTDITAKELLDHVRSGVVENVRILPEKMCAFISFLDEPSALLFHSDAILKRLTIKENDIKVGWGRNVPMSSTVLASIQRDNATRNVYFGNLPKDITEEKLMEDLSEFGTIDTIKILDVKGVAFVHFCSILSAVKVVQTLATTNKEYADKKIFYGKDRCAFITKTQQHNAA